MGDQPMQGVGSAWFVIVVCLYGRGRGVENYPTDLAAIGPWQVAAGLLWIWTTNLIRVSMGMMLLRLKEERRWKWPLRILVLDQVCLMIAATTVQLLVCRPLSSMWNPTPDMECIPVSGMVTYGIVYNGKGSRPPPPVLEKGVRRRRANRHLRLPPFSFEHCERYRSGRHAAQLHS